MQTHKWQQDITNLDNVYEYKATQILDRFNMLCAKNGVTIPDYAGYDLKSMSPLAQLLNAIDARAKNLITRSSRNATETTFDFQNYQLLGSRNILSTLQNTEATFSEKRGAALLKQAILEVTSPEQYQDKPGRGIN